MNAIQTTGISKYYGRTAAVDKLNMTVPEGSIYGFIGRNGAGKSTALKMMCGLASCSGGEIKIFGKPVTDSLTAKRIGVLIEDAGLYPHLTAYQNLNIQSIYLGLTDSAQRIKEVLSLVQLEDTGKKKVKAFSMGMKQRLGVALAMLGSPDMLILDEPINGLDPEGIRGMRELLLSFQKDYGMTILISSHILGELSKIATHYGIIKNGRLIKELTAEALYEECQDYLLIKTAQPAHAAALLEEKLSLTGYRIYPEGEIRIYGEADTQAVSSMLTGAGIVILELSRHKQDLEQYFLGLMEEKERSCS